MPSTRALCDGSLSPCNALALLQIYSSPRSSAPAYCGCDRGSPRATSWWTGWSHLLSVHLLARFPCMLTATPGSGLLTSIIALAETITVRRTLGAKMRGLTRLSVLDNEELCATESLRCWRHAKHAFLPVVFLAFYSIEAKLFANSLLASLNERNSARRGIALWSTKPHQASTHVTFDAVSSRGSHAIAACDACLARAKRHSGADNGGPWIRGVRTSGHATSC